MPKIPSFKENQRTNPRNPTGFQRTSQSRLSGETLSNFGRGISTVGAGLLAADARAKDATRRLAAQDYKNALTRRLQDAHSEVTRSDATGSKYVEKFDEMSSEIQADLGEEFGEKYNGEYGEDFRIAGDAIVAGSRKGIHADAFKKQEDFIRKGTVQLTNEMNAQAYTNPAMIDSLSTDYTNTIGGMMRDLGATDAKIREAHTAGQTALVNSAIDGYIQKEDWNGAKLLIQRDFAGLFNREAANARMKEIQAAQTQADRQKLQAVAAAEKEAEKNHKNAQLETASKLMGTLALATQNNDHKKIYKVKQEIIKSGTEGDILYSSFGGMLSKADKGYKSANAYSDYDMTRRIYQAKSSKDLEKLRPVIKAKVDSGRMAHEAGNKHEKAIHNLLKQSTSNPRLAKRYESAFSKLEAFTGTTSWIDQLTDMDAKSSAHRRKNFAKAALKAHQAAGTDPDLATSLVVSEYFTGTDAVAAFPGYGGKSIRKEEELDAFSKWASGKFRNDPVGLKQASDHIKEVRDALQVDAFIKESLKGNYDAAAQSAADRVSSGLDEDELVKQNGNKQSIIEQMINSSIGEPNANQR